MPLFLTVLEGATPGTAKPILAIRDTEIIGVVRELINARLATASPARPRMHAVPQCTPQETQSEAEEVPRGPE